MKSLISGDLEFKNFNKDKCFSSQESEDKTFYEYCIQQLNSWNDESITKWLELEDEPLGDSINNTLSIFDKTASYFVFKEQELVGSTLLTLQPLLNDMIALQNYIDHCKFLKVDRFNDFMLIKTATKILENIFDNNCYINCLAVNPKYQHQGIGSQIISTLANDIDFFAPPSTTSIMARIHKDNIASETAFKNNGFETFFKIDLSDYNTFYKTL